MSCENDVLFNILVHGSMYEWNRKRHAHNLPCVCTFGKKQKKKNKIERKMKSYAMQLIIFVNIEWNPNCVTVHCVHACIAYVYSALLVWCQYDFLLCVWVWAVWWIFNIRHCIHAFALIVLQSTTSNLLHVYRLHFRIQTSCTIAYWVKWKTENICDAFFIHCRIRY